MRTRDTLLATGVFAQAMAVSAAALAAGVAVTHEDGFFYLTLARNLAHGLGATFDGLHPTNGYHPLWTLCLVPVIALADSPTAGVVLSTLLEGALLGGASLLVFRTVRLRNEGEGALVAGLAWTVLTWRTALGGTEFALHGLLLAGVAYTLCASFDAGSPADLWPYRRLGLLLALLVLCRVECLVLAAVVAGWLSWSDVRRGPWRDAARRAAWVGGPPLLVAALYAGVNLAAFGNPLPVSAAVKAEWSAHALAQDPRAVAHGWLFAKLANALWPVRAFLAAPASGDVHVISLLFGNVAACVLGSGVMRRGAWSAPLGAWALLSFGLYALVYHGNLSFVPWYYAVQPLLLALFLAFVVDAALDSVRRSRGWPVASRVLIASLAAVLAVAPFAAIRSWRAREGSGDAPQPLREAATWTRAHVPAGARIVSWNPGALSYLGQRTVIDLDGLVNSWDYWATRRHDLCRYWDEERAEYLVDLFDSAEHPVAPEPTTPDFAACAHRLEHLWTGADYRGWHAAAYRWPGER